MVEDDDDDDDDENDSDNDDEAAKVEEEIVSEADGDEGLEVANDASEDSAVSAGNEADGDGDDDDDGEAGAEESAAPKSNEGFEGTEG